MNDQAQNSEWTKEDEAAWQAMQDEAEEQYEQSVCNHYAARGQANLY